MGYAAQGRIQQAVAAAFALLIALAPAQAQSDWPSRPVRLVVPATAGGVNDAVARLLGEGLSKRLGQPFVPENIAGAASMIGTAAVVKSAPDGHTLLLAAIAPLGIVPHVRKAPYVVERDLAPVGLVATQPHLLLVNPDKMPVKTLPEFIQRLKGNPGKYNYASSGAGQLNHLEMELLMLKTGTRMTHVPYKSSGDQATALIGGHVDCAVFGITAALPYIKAGTVRPIAVMTAERYPELPELPAVREVVTDFGGVFSWHGLLVPAATPRPIVGKLNTAMVDYLRSAEGIAQMKKIGAEAVGSSPEQFAELIRYESGLWADVIDRAQLQIQ
ncbi:MAG: tripartite tricarboxylate transporter substrate binding protein [Pseudomonadota bacterium]